MSGKSSRSNAAYQTQSTFRAVLRAFSYPGEIISTEPFSNTPTAMGDSLFAAALCLLDNETKVWLDPALNTQEVRDILRMQNGVPQLSDPSEADFALIADAPALLDLKAFRFGTLLEPNLSTTLLIQVPSLTDGEPASLSGPGIKDEKSIAPSGLPKWFWSAWLDNASKFPLGLDVIFFDGARLTGLPRSVRGTTKCS
ncbi:phosphonate C-P lyase system protein PhnH [Rhizobium sp. 1AS11]|uniref:phosphonate C-P lyase system protein PhnH n=1 Tax=Rhizobium acaciae TaxID=2989736 RepID=UPI0022223350|nr:phosphonate C-P lyase system protein PhnH [Rhizobium acaciae]MCW1412992.1 phosphonate C-P lyase system protein PhnH [Rhizobium acaciae]MCW1745144.1 phosphonate C-P lyase system protein PhnH [Rhizobium acaciae]